MADIASTYSDQHRREEAEKLQIQVMETRKTKLGPNHPDTLSIMADLALTYSNQDRWKEAEKLQIQVMEARKIQLGADHLDTLAIMANLASTYSNQGQWEEAEKLEVHVMEARKMKLGADHPNALLVSSILAIFGSVSLCGWCTNLFTGDPDRYHKLDEENKYKTKPRKLSRIKNGASLGCLMCSEIWSDAVRKNRTDDDAISFEASGSVVAQNDDLGYQGPVTLNFHFYSSTTEKTSNTQSTMFTCFSSAEFPWTPSLTEETSSSSTLDLAQKWTQSCFEQHSECVKFQTSDWMPTRVLEVDTKTWKLRMPAEENIAIEKYVTLSYCWGKDPFLNLTTGVFNSFKGGHPIAQLPKTFQEAISVANYFGIKYIWIDALCIIQDSTEDWIKESGKMCKVYSNAYCNLIAAASENPHGGLFRRRNRSCPPLATIKPKWANGNQYSMLSSIDSVGAMNLYYDELNSTNTAFRGWILQERILAPRLLCFCNNQVYFECEQGIKSEVCPSGPPSYMNVGCTGSHDGSPMKRWSSLVDEYSACLLTKPSDKLVALSGVADRYSEILNDTYVAGLWQSQLPWNLMWYVQQGQEAKRAETYRAPTWSWASIDGNLFMNYEGDYTNPTCYVEGIKVNVETQGASQTGQVRGGDLRLIAPAATVTKVSDGWSPWIFNDKGGLRCNATISADIESEDFQVGDLATLVLLLSEQSDKTRIQFEGLVLKPVGARSGTYTRAGKFTFYDFDYYERDLREFGIRMTKKDGAISLDVNSSKKQSFIIL